MNKDDYTIYSVNVPLKRDKEINFNPNDFVIKRGNDFPVLSMDDQMAKRIGVNLFPKILVIDKDRKVKYRGAFRYNAKGRYNFENILNEIDK